MTAYLLLIFLLPPNGNITAIADPQLYIGADVCQAKAAEVVAAAKDPEAINVLCIDSRMVPGRGA